MKSFDEITVVPEILKAELEDLRDLVDRNGLLSERKILLPFFRERRHLAAMLGALHPAINDPDRLAFEYDLFGDFACDIAVGDSIRSAYVFIELEEAGPASIFVKRGRKHTPAWSPRFDHGFSQIIDWFWKLADMRPTDDFRERFGPGVIDYNAMLIVGRSASFGHRETHRWSWRPRHVVVDSRHVNCFAYDELYSGLRGRLDLFRRDAEGPD